MIDSTITDSQVIANEFNNFFVSIGRKLSEDIISTVSPLSFVTQVNNSIFIEEVSVTEVRTTILSLKNSSPCWDEFPMFVTKASIDNYIMPLIHIINKSLKEGVFPSELKLAKVGTNFKSWRH